MTTATVVAKQRRRGRVPFGRRAGRDGGMLRWIPGLVVFGAAVAVYLTALPNGFVSDAQGLIPDNPSLLGSHEWLAWFRRPYFWGSYVVGERVYRPLSILSYVVTIRLAGPGPLAFLAGNVVLHALASLLVFLLGRRLVGAQAAWLGGLLFAVHPLHTEVVAWIGGRPDLLSAVFGLGSALAFLKATQISARRPAIFALATVVLFFAAVNCKEHVVLLPIWFAAVWLVEREKRSPGWAATTLAASLAAAAAFMAIRLSVVRPARGLAGVVRSGAWNEWWGWATGLATTAKYTWLFIWPRALTFDYTGDLSSWVRTGRVAPLEVAAGVVCVAVFVVALVWACRRDRGLALSLAFVPVTYFVTSGFPFTPQLYLAERFTYLPSAGGCLAVGWVCARIGRAVVVRARSASGPDAESAIPRWHAAGTRGLLLGVVFLGIVAALGIRTAIRNTDWRNDDAVTLAAIAVSPDSPLALRRLGHEQFVLRNFDKAREFLERSLELNPRRTEPYVLLAQVYRQQGDVQALVQLSVQAETYLARRRQLFDIAGALWQVGRRDEAERLMTSVVAAHPDFTPARLALGGLLLDGRQPDAALEQFKTVTMLEPTNGLAWLGMARAASSLGRAGEARAYFNHAQGLGTQ